MQARMKNPALLLPEAMRAIQALVKAVQSGPAKSELLELVHLRASQLNGCGFCVDMNFREIMKGGEDARRLFAVSAWREMPYFTDAERAALALSEAVTRLCDRSDPVPDEVWDEAARHFTEEELGALLLWIATTNLFNRLNCPRSWASSVFAAWPSTPPRHGRPPPLTRGRSWCSSSSASR
jgi:AhpD family alkylhydroperoxidase